MVQIYYGDSNDWDQHADIVAHKVHAGRSDQALAALIQDLKQQGLLDKTLVLIGSEFGRTPVLNLGGFQSVHNRRDHNVHGFTSLLAGGGVKSGTFMERRAISDSRRLKRQCMCMTCMRPLCSYWVWTTSDRTPL